MSSPIPSADAQEPPWTVGKLLQWTTAHFTRKGLGSPRLEAEVLLADALACPRIQLYADWDAPVDQGHRAKYREFVQRRSAGCPSAYLIGKREFYSLEFAVSADTLIPRPETELLVGQAIAFARQLESCRFADVGVGSGAIAVAIAHACPGCTGVGIDVSESALLVAAGNAKRHGVSDRLWFLRSDLLEAVEAGERFDLIVSNPPYIPTADWALLSPEVRDFEPRLALDGGSDGLELYRRLIPQAAGRLRPGGMLLLEIGVDQEPAVRRILETDDGFDLRPTIRDGQRIPRTMVAVRRA